jgi:flagellar biosynthesis/type III secretory pathway chaperone
VIFSKGKKKEGSFRNMINTVNPAAAEWIVIQEKLIEITGNLLEAAKRKHAILASDTLDALQDILQQEEAMAAELEKVEARRLVFLRTYKTWPATLSEQITFLPEPDREQAAELARKLARTAEQLYIQNCINSEIIQHLLNYASCNLDQLYKMTSGPAYGSRGDVPLPVAGRAVVDRKI